MIRAPQAVTIRRFRAIGTDAVVAVTEAATADGAATIAADRLDELDRTCSRFRSDAEIARACNSGGAPVKVSALLFRVIANAIDVARMTAGAVDPTVGGAIGDLGYDRDFSLLEGVELSTSTDEPDGADTAAASVGHVPAVRARPAPGWWTVELDAASGTVAVPDGVVLDVGSSAKALAADEAAAAIVSALPTGVLVSLGGDVAAAGPWPDGGWAVGIAEGSAAQGADVEQVVSIAGGGIASSAPGVRTWHAAGAARHHIVDPWSGECAPVHWRLVSVAGPTCVAANALSTAALVWGPDAPDRLAGYGLPARLVRDGDGTVVTVGGWPAAGATLRRCLEVAG